MAYFGEKQVLMGLYHGAGWIELRIWLWKALNAKQEGWTFCSRKRGPLEEFKQRSDKNQSMFQRSCSPCSAWWTDEDEIQGQGTFQEAVTKTLGFLDGSVGKEFACDAGDTHGFDPWVGKIPWRRKWQLTPVFFPGKSHWQRRLAGYSPWGRAAKSQTCLNTWHMPHDMSQNPGGRTSVRAMAMGWTGGPRFWNIGEVPQPPPLSLAPKISAKEDRKVWILTVSYLDRSFDLWVSLSSLIWYKGMITYLTRVVKMGEKVCHMSSTCLAWSQPLKDRS